MPGSTGKPKYRNNSTIEVQILLIALIILGLFILYQQKDNLFHQFTVHKGLFLGLFILVFVLIVGVWVFPSICRIYFYFKRSREMERVEVVLSRDDTTKPDEIVKFFEFVNGALLSEFPLLGFFKGFDHFIWEVTVDNQNRAKTIRLAAGKSLSYCARQKPINTVKKKTRNTGLKKL